LPLPRFSNWHWGRNPICTCGYVALWHPRLDAGNNQHIADGYTLSHIIHGFLFYLLAWIVLRSRPPGERLILAVAIEAVWEVLENSPSSSTATARRRSRLVM
jgi:hypothetical protein